MALYLTGFIVVCSLIGGSAFLAQLQAGRIEVIVSDPLHAVVA
jgi:hypothetical protein